MFSTHHKFAILRTQKPLIAIYVNDIDLNLRRIFQENVR